jgi:hypothetical protein
VTIAKRADDHDRSPTLPAPAADPLPETSVTLVELLAGYLDHCEAYYVKNGKQTTTVQLLRRMMRF